MPIEPHGGLPYSMIPFWGVDVGSGAAITSALSCQLTLSFDMGKKGETFPVRGLERGSRYCFSFRSLGQLLEPVENGWGRDLGPLPLDLELHLGLEAASLQCLWDQRTTQKNPSWQEGQVL